MEIFVPSTGSRPMAGENGNDARSASSCGEGGGGASACMRFVEVFGGGASSVRIGGGCRGAGCGGVVSMVLISAARCGGRGVGAGGGGGGGGAGGRRPRRRRGE